MKESEEDISARAEERYGLPKGSLNNQEERYFNTSKLDKADAFIEGYKACLAAQSQGVEESKWIDVNERLPEEEGEYLTHEIDRDYTSVCYWDLEVWVYLASVKETPTHWQSLPSAPIKKNEI